MTRPPNCGAVRLAVAITLAIGAAGCGQAEYEARLEQNLGVLRSRAMFSDLYDSPVTLPGTPVTVQLPKFIDATAKAYSEQPGDPGGQAASDTSRVQPPFVKLPGLRATYELSTTDTATNQQAFDYCYFAAVPEAEASVGGKPLDQYVQESVAAAFPGPAQWQQVDCPQPNGSTRAWQWIGASGGQPFANPNGASGNAAGTFRLYMAEVGGWRVLIGWRFHEANFVNTKIEDIAKVVAGTAAVAQAAAPAGP